MSEHDQNGQSLKEKLAAKMGHIKGWAIDADPKNDPTYPMRQRSEHTNQNWLRPSQQPGHEEVLHSNERPDVTRVFGTAAPVSGLSGCIRRCAFKYSEGRFAHWLLLLLADPVNMVEGFAEDLCHGRGTQCVSDKGMNARWQHDRKALVTEAAVGVTVVGVLAAICFRRHLLPHKRHLPGLLQKHSRLQAFIRDYERMMKR